VILFPNCKINIGLNVLAKRADGFHDIQSVFYPLPLKDILESVPASKFGMQLTGIPLTGSLSENLCFKAYHQLKKRFPGIPAVDIYLHKNIPIGAGLGGGSSDAAFLLMLLNRQFDLGLTNHELLQEAMNLGSDCPFFIVNRPCLAQGRGELLDPVEIDLSGYRFMLVHPHIQLSTAEAFASIVPSRPALQIKEIITRPVASWPGRLVNDFEEVAMRKHPLLQSVKKKLYDAGALYASMTGSGSSFFGIFEKDSRPSISFEQDLRVDII